MPSHNISTLSRQTNSEEKKMSEFLNSVQRAASVHSGKKATKRKKEKWGTILAMTKNMRLLSVNLRDSVISKAVGAMGPGGRGELPPPIFGR